MVNFHGPSPIEATDVLDITSLEIPPDNLDCNANNLSFTLAASPTLYTHPSILLQLRMKVALNPVVSFDWS